MPAPAPGAFFCPVFLVTAMGNTASDTTQAPLTFIKGVDNRSNETKIAAGYARAADNVDIDRDGTVSVRDGYALLTSLPGAHSCWADESLSFYAFVADATSLYLIGLDGTLTTLATGLAGTDVHYAPIGGRIHWSNGYQTGIVTAHGAATPWGVETPLLTFALSASTIGGLHAGRYGVTMTFANAAREEGGAPDPVYIDVAEGGGILITSIPAALGTGVVSARVYRTDANGPDFLYTQSATPGAGQLLLGTQQLGRLLTTLFKDRFPAALYLLAKAGRIFGAVGRRLVYSDPLYYGLTNTTDNFLTFPDDITMIAAPESAQFVMYVATTKKVYMLTGATVDTATRTTVANVGAIPGSMAMIPPEEAALENVDTPIPFWVGGDGIPYVGTTVGVQPLSARFVYPIYDKAGAAFLQDEGRSRYVVSGQGGRTSGLAASDSAVATVFNNGGGE